MAVKKKAKKKKVKKKIAKSLKTGKKFYLSDEMFWGIAVKCKGFAALIAATIRKEFNMPYSDQAAHQRMKKNPERLEALNNTVLDSMEIKLHKKTESNNERVALQAIMEILHAKGKARGYGKQQKIELEDKRPRGVIALPPEKPEPKQQNEKSIN
jgi:hypothetical protein|tara:strand:- start:356 stop:820 length:465 start_codon:yes stop_codon:yes gene_type:complete